MSTYDVVEGEGTGSAAHVDVEHVEHVDEVVAREDVEDAGLG